MALSGGCTCGAVRYECSADPLGVALCYCRDCQRSSGGAFATIVIAPASGVKVTKGRPKGHGVKAESGNPVTREFCGDCGSPLFGKPQAFPNVLGITAASLDDPSQLKPSMAIWVDSAQPWAPIPDNLARFPKNPPM